jgi:hypothetical protein
MKDPFKPFQTPFFDPLRGLRDVLDPPALRMIREIGRGMRALDESPVHQLTRSTGALDELVAPKLLRGIERLLAAPRMLSSSRALVGTSLDAAVGRLVERSRFAAESLAFGVISGASAQPASWRAGALIA